MLKKILSFSSLVWFACSCGVNGPELKKLEKSPQVVEPKYRKASFESMLEDLSEEGRTFAGSLIVWDAKADPLKVSEVITASNEAKRAEVVYKKSLQPLEVVKNNLSRLEESITSVEKQLELKRAEHLSKHLESLLTQIEQMNAVHQDVAKNSLKAEYKDAFETFCDAKYVAFLSSDHLLNNIYSKRPTPFSLCEKYYEEKAYFSDETCQAKPEGQNYLKCFWTPQFIKNSKLELHDRTGGEYRKLPKETYNWEDLAVKWAAKDWQSYFQNKDNREFLQGGLLMLSDDEEVYLYFDGELKKVSENLTPALEEYFTTDYSLQSLNKNYNNIEGVSYNHSHLLFNYPLLLSEEKQNLFRLGNGFSSLASSSKKDTELYGLVFEELETSDLEESKSLIGLLEKKQKQQQELVVLQVDSDKKQASLLELKSNIAKKLAEENLAHSLWPNMELIISRESIESPMVLSWGLDQELFTDTFTSEVSEKPIQGSEESGNAMTSTFNREKASFEFSLKGSALESMGWDQFKKYETGPRFNSISLAEREVTELKVALDYVHYEKTVPMFTGKLFIYNKNGEELYLGSILLTSN